MNLVATIVGRTILLTPAHEIAPIGGVYLPSLFDAVRSRYSFQTVPNVATAQEQGLKEGYKFSIGKIRKGGRDFPIQDFVVFADGIVCTADSTEISEFFLEDLITFLVVEFDFRPITPKSRRLFYSQVSVNFEKPLSNLVTHFESLFRAIGEVQRTTYGIQTPDGVQLHSISLDFDKTQVPSAFSSLSPFTIERRLNKPYSENVFFSAAPLRTQDHIKTLEKIEKALSA